MRKSMLSLLVLGPMLCALASPAISGCFVIGYKNGEPLCQTKSHGSAFPNTARRAECKRFCAQCQQPQPNGCTVTFNRCVNLCVSNK